MLIKSWRLLCLLFAAILIGCLPLAVSAQLDTEIDFEELEGSPITLGEAVTGTLDEDNPIATYTFDAEEGDSFSVVVAEETFYASHLIITNLDGDVVAFSDDDNVGDAASRIPLFIAPEDGTYKVSVTTFSYFISGDKEDTVDYSLTLDETKYKTIAYGDTVEGQLTNDENVVIYVFEAEAGDLPQVILKSDSTTSKVTVASLDDVEFDLRSGNNPVGSTDSYVTPFYVYDDGLLSIIVQNFGYEFGEDSYKLTLQPYAALELKAGDSITMPIAIETISNFATFEAEEEQEVTITADAPESVDPQLALFDPDGNVIAVESGADGIQKLELEQNGVYTLMVYPGSWMVELSNLGEVEVGLKIED